MASAGIKFLLGLVLVGLLVFLPAGTMDFFNGWLLIAVLFVPMLIAGVALSGIVMLSRLLQPVNANSPMLVTLPSVGMTLLWHPAIKVLLSVSIKQFPAE